MRRQFTLSLLLAAVSTVSAFAPTTSIRPQTAASFSLPTKITLNHDRRSAESSTSLHMANPGFAVAAITGAVSGGFVAGSLHAIAGKKSAVRVPMPNTSLPFHIVCRILIALCHFLTQLWTASLYRIMYRPRPLGSSLATLLWTKMVPCRTRGCTVGHGPWRIGHSFGRCCLFP